MKKLVLPLGVLAAAVGISALATPESSRADQGGQHSPAGAAGLLGRGYTEPFAGL